MFKIILANLPIAIHLQKFRLLSIINYLNLYLFRICQDTIILLLALYHNKIKIFNKINLKIKFRIIVSTSNKDIIKNCQSLYPIILRNIKVKSWMKHYQIKFNLVIFSRVKIKKLTTKIMQFKLLMTKNNN